jgi:hypothetical protein
LGISPSFGAIDFENLVFRELTFPLPVKSSDFSSATKMRVDYIRVYQETGSINIGCDPPDFPTKSYIDR